MRYKIFENGILVGYSDTKISGAIEMTEEEILELKNKDELRELRQQREDECFSIINRGQLWYDTLTEEQRQDLEYWYLDWLDVTETKTIPERPTWLK